MKRVLLINSNTETAPYPVAPLGLSLVASSIKNNYDVKVIDFAFSKDGDLIKAIEVFKPNYIGVSIRNIDNVTMRRCKWYLPIIKERIIDVIKDFKIPVILGGSGFNIAPSEILKYLDADYGIFGEGEKSFNELLDSLDKNLNVKNIKGVISKRLDGDINLNSDLKNIEKANVDQNIDFNPYSLKGSYPIQTKRGCTHKCIYCSYPNVEGKQYRLREVVDIVDEIEEVHSRLPKITFEFVDSTFNSPLKHAIEICKEIINRDLKVKLRTMGVNPGEVTEELVDLMKKAGFTQIDCTPDSASVKMIKSYKKNFTISKLIECAKIIKRYDMPTMWFFMLGAPGETEETIKETFQFIDDYIYEEDMVHITEGIRIIPNTVLYDIAIKEGVIDSEASVIEPMFYVDPNLGRENLCEVLDKEVAKRTNVLNSIDTQPSKELMKKALDYRKENNIEEPMFRTLLRLEKTITV